jgi:hypothetical protein
MLDFLLELFDRGDVIEKKVVVSTIGNFFQPGTEIAGGIAKWVAEKKAPKNLFLIVPQEIGQRFTTDPRFSNPRHVGQGFKNFEGMGFFQLFCFLVPFAFGEG